MFGLLRVYVDFLFSFKVIQANSVRKTQIMELGLLREEEKQNFKRQEENLVC